MTPLAQRLVIYIRCQIFTKKAIRDVKITLLPAVEEAGLAYIGKSAAKSQLK
jgi:hypothetical protein